MNRLLLLFKSAQFRLPAKTSKAEIHPQLFSFSNLNVPVSERLLIILQPECSE